MSNYPDNINDSRDDPNSPLYDGADYDEDTDTYTFNGIEMTADEYQEYKEQKVEVLRKALRDYRRKAGE